MNEQRLVRAEFDKRWVTAARARLVRWELDRFEPRERIGNWREVLLLAGERVEVEQLFDVARRRMRRERLWLIRTRPGGFQIGRVLQRPARLRRRLPGRDEHIHATANRLEQIFATE